ncbi:MAG TPA: succinylglutamate desuccinylase/aspartoacylase family protein [Lacunisphaera sp.]|nr:succinylglutamate desuccinylase/aspartoacylase family protein [Lacunisphaera sp.]
MSLANTIKPGEPVYPHKLRRLYWPFLALAEVCREVVGTVVGSFEWEQKRYTIPRFVFLGPPTNVPPLRLGIFALLHGDEPAGALGLERFLNGLVNEPALAAGYELAIYPLCNPTGYEDGTRHNRAGADLNREFWRSSAQPEVKILEEELRGESFDGIIALHADDTSDGLYGYTQGRVLTENLLAPALRASSHVIPVNPGALIDGFAGREGLIQECYPGILAPPPEKRPQPFEVIFETAARAPMTQQVEAIGCALRSVLAEYRRFIAQGANL